MSGVRSRGRTHSSSKMAIMRCASGFVAIWGIIKNSSFESEPDPSLSSFIKRFFSRWISAAETGLGSSGGSGNIVREDRAFDCA